jgi:hypothetical protein
MIRTARACAARKRYREMAAVLNEQHAGGLSCWKRERWVAAASVDRHEFHDINRQAETAHDFTSLQSDRERRIDRVIYGDGFIYGYVYLLT